MQQEPSRFSKREKKKLVYLPDGVVVDEYKWTKMLESKKTKIHEFKATELAGYELTYEYMQENEFAHPILVADPEGLEMNIPEVSVPKVAELVGPDRIVDVLEVSTQTDRQMKLSEWAAYFTLPEEKRERILNVISLEIGESKLGKMVKRPRIVRELDWIDNVWPRDILIHEYPRVQLYCLMGVKDSYTDFHIDFGGTSVFYHIITGEKTFFFIEPTKRNLDIYAMWSTSPSQSDTFLGDLIPECAKISLQAGQTLFIPSGWIHAVFTPKDTIVIGGNFLHCFAIESQLKIAQMEKDTNVPMRFRFPYFANMQWYAAKKYLYNLKDISLSFSVRELVSLQALVDHLKKLAYSSTDFQRFTKAERKTIRSEIPAGLNNVRLLLQTLEFVLQSRRNGKRLLDSVDDWESAVSEMEFVDSEDELQDFLPPDVDPLTDEELDASEDDDRGFESSDDDDSDSKEKKAKKKPRKVSKTKMLKKKPLKPNAPVIIKLEAPSAISKLQPQILQKSAPVFANIRPDQGLVRINQNPTSNKPSAATTGVVSQVDPLSKNSHPTTAQAVVLPKSTLIMPKPNIGSGNAAPPSKKKAGVFDRLMKKMKKR